MSTVVPDPEDGSESVGDPSPAPMRQAWSGFGPLVLDPTPHSRLTRVPHNVSSSGRSDDPLSMDDNTQIDFGGRPSHKVHSFSGLGI